LKHPLSMCTLNFYKLIDKILGESCYQSFISFVCENLKNQNSKNHISSLLALGYFIKSVSDQNERIGKYLNVKHAILYILKDISAENINLSEVSLWNLRNFIFYSPEVAEFFPIIQNQLLDVLDRKLIDIELLNSFEQLSICSTLKLLVSKMGSFSEDIFERCLVLIKSNVILNH
jgi:hypothetical protein